jgi:hypothetical protein
MTPLWYGILPLLYSGSLENNEEVVLKSTHKLREKRDIMGLVLMTGGERTVRYYGNV